MRICEEELLWNLKVSVMVRLPAYDLVKKAFDDRAKKQSAFAFEIYQNGPSKLIVSENR